jgi:hypothetical protein
MWIIAFCVAAVAVVPVVLLENRTPWLVAIPIIVGFLLGIIFEATDDLRERSRAQKFTQLFAEQELTAQSGFAVTAAFVDAYTGYSKLALTTSH